MKYLFLILLLPNLIFSQDYKSVIIPFDKNATPTEIVTVGEAFTLPVLHVDAGDVVSTYIIIDDNLDTVFTKSYASFSVRSKAPAKIRDNFYQFVKNNNEPRFMTTIKMNSAFDLLASTNHSSESNVNVSNTFSVYNDFIYGVVADIFQNPDRWQYSVKKIDTLGSEKWSITIGEEENYTNAWESCISASGLIAISSEHRVNFQSMGQLHLFSEDGNIVQEYQDDDTMKSSGVGHWIACLNNDKFALSTTVDRRTDIEFLENNWAFYPPRISLINNEGEFQKDIILTSPLEEPLTNRFIENGKENYFFGGGVRAHPDAFNGDYGWLYKMDGEGNMIWNRIYYHPSFANQGYYHTIIDIIEEDNGDILTLGVIRKPGENNKIWVQRLRADGCFDDENCGIILSTSEAEALANEINIYPNPSYDIFKITTSIEIEKIIVFNVYGDIIKSESSNFNQLDLSDFPGGIYYIKIFDNSSKSAIKKVIKL